MAGEMVKMKISFQNNKPGKYEVKRQKIRHAS
jgi:hypothetical protein